MRHAPFTVVLLLTACVGPSRLDAGVEDAGLVMDFSTGRKILTYLEGKTLVMTGADIPLNPNGISESFGLGANTQCYRAITLRMTGGAFAATVELGRLTAPLDGGAALCDHTVTTGTNAYDSQAVLIDNAQDNGRCFDLTSDYGAFGEEGRGRIDPDGAKVTLELYYRGRALQHRCEDGAVGAPTVHLLIGGGASVPFTGDALQVYRIQ